MAKLSVSLDDDLATQLKAVAGPNVSAYVAAAVKARIEHQQLYGLLAELEDEMGPVDEDEVASVITSLQGDVGSGQKTPRRRPRAS